MKLSFLFILFLILGSYCPNLFSQKSKISFGKNIVSVQCGETVFYLITEKNKTGLYNSTTSSYIIEPVQNFFYYFDTYNLLFTCSALGKIEVYNVAELEKGLAPHPLTLSSYSNNPIIYSFGANNFDENNLVLADGYLSQYKSEGMVFLKDSSAIYNKLTAINSANNFYFGIEKYNNIIIITDFKDVDSQGELKTIASIQYPDEDSISADGDVLYYPRKSGYQRTGLYNISSGNWEIPKQYAQISKVNNVFICMRYAMEEIVEYKSSYYDFYIQTGAEIVATDYQNVHTNGGFPLKLLFEQNSYTPDQDSSYVYFQTAQGMGLARVQLFYPYWSGYGYNVFGSGGPKIIIDTLLEAKNDLILKSGRDQSTFVTKVGEQFTFHFIPPYESNPITVPIPFLASFGISNTFKEDPDYQNSNYLYPWRVYFIDNKFYTDSSDSNIPKPVEASPVFFSDLDYDNLIRVLDDSLIYVQYWIKENTGTYTEPGKINYSYYKYNIYPKPGQYESGIYDMKNKRWLISPNQAYIINAPEGYLVCTPVLNENGNLIHYSYAFLNKQIKILQSYISFDSLSQSELINSYAFPELKITNKVKVDSEFPNYYYYQSVAKFGLIDMNGFKTLCEPSDYVYYNASHNLIVTIHGKNIIINWGSNKGEITIDSKFNLNLISTASNIDFVQTIQDEKFILYLNENGGELSKIPYKGSSFQKYGAESTITSKSFKLIALNENLLYIEDWRDDQIIDDDAASQRTVLGHARSGILNIVTGEWLIEPENIWIKTASDGNYLAKKKLVGKNSEVLIVYSLISPDGKVIFENKSKIELPDNCKKLVK